MKVNGANLQKTLRKRKNVQQLSASGKAKRMLIFREDLKQLVTTHAVAPSEQHVDKMVNGTMNMLKQSTEEEIEPMPEEKADLDFAVSFLRSKTTKRGYQLLRNSEQRTGLQLPPYRRIAAEKRKWMQRAVETRDLTTLKSKCCKAGLTMSPRLNLHVLWRKMQGGAGFRVHVQKAVHYAISKYSETLKRVDGAINIRISGDGTHWGSGKVKPVRFGFSFMNFLDGTHGVQDRLNQFSLAYYVGKEDGAGLKTHLGEVFDELRLLQQDGLVVDGKLERIVLHLSADYKFLIAALGRPAVTSDTACIFCRVPSADRPKFLKPEETAKWTAWTAEDGFYDPARNLLHFIPLDRIYIDELHYLLRAWDVLCRCMVTHFPSWHAAILKEIKRLGVSFYIKQERESTAYKFPRLSWQQIRKVLEQFEFQNVVPADFADRNNQVEQANKLFRGVAELHENLHAVVPKLKGGKFSDEASVVYSWILTSRIFKTKCITPYAHLVMDHAGGMLERLGSLSIASCSPNEYCNHADSTTFSRVTTRGGCGNNPLRDVLNLSWASQLASDALERQLSS